MKEHTAKQITKMLADGFAVHLDPVQEEIGAQVVHCVVSRGGNEAKGIGADIDDAVKNAAEHGWKHEG